MTVLPSELVDFIDEPTAGGRKWNQLVAVAHIAHDPTLCMRCALELDVLG